MADILQAIANLTQAEKDAKSKVEEGEIKEFLRGTISIMDIKENCAEQLDELKAKFLKCRKELGGLDINEFEEAVTPLISKGISRHQILTTFQKMDPCDDGAISWNDFINFAIEEHNKRIQMRATMSEMPFSPEAFKKRHSHSDTFMTIAFMPTVDPVSLHVDWGNGKYVMLSREGVMSVWTATMKNLSYTFLSGRGRPSPDWNLDLVTMYHNGFVAVATTLREISFFDYNMQGWSKKYWLRGLEHCVTKMHYWAGLEKEKIAVLLWGDTSGSVTMLEFELSQRTPLFGIPVKEYCIELSYSDLVKGVYKGVTFRIFKNVHSDWVKQVRYMPKTNSILSCCADNATGLFMTPTEPTKRKACYFTTIKGILSFDYSQNINLVAAASIDNNIWLYNPYVPHKVIAIMEGHTRPITHVKINEEENYLLSVDMGRNVHVFNITTQYTIMRIPSQVLKMGFYPIHAVYLNQERKMCILGGSSLVILKRRRLEGLNVEVRSHDEKLVAALYSPAYEQVVSVCRGAVIRVWDLNTGTRVMQFTMAHSKKVHGRIVPVEIECAALTDNKKRLFTAAEGVVKIWNFSCGVLLRVLEPCMPHQRINSIVVAKSIIYITGWSKAITLYSDFKGEELVKKVWPQKHNEDILGLCILEPNLISSFSYDGQIIVWSRETTESYCRMSASFGHRPELETAVTTGGKGANIMGAANAMDDNSDEGEDEGEDSFMTIGKHLRKEGGWYRGIRAIKRRQIEREKRRMAKERKDFTAKFKKKKKRMNMQGLSLVYESAVECMIFLESRKAIDSHTATIVAAGAECWVRFWSLHPKGGLLGQFNSTRRKLESIRCMTTDKDNEYLLTGDTMGHLRIWDIKEFCNGTKLTPEEKEARDMRLRKEFVYTKLPFKPEEVLNTMEKLRAMRISVPDASKPRKNLKSPRLLSSIRCHTQAIMTIELIEERNVILTSSQDRTVRLWTKNCTYIGTFGEHWRPLPPMVGPVVELNPRIPKDLLRCASARSLGTLHNGVMPHWKVACTAVRRHIIELQRERQIEEAREKLKQERRARGEPTSDDEESTGEKPASKVLGKYYQPKHRYKGPLTTQALGFPTLKLFNDKCAPYSSIPPRDFYPLTPLYSSTTLIDVDSRRRKKSKRGLRQMLNQFSAICGEIPANKIGDPISRSSNSDHSSIDAAMKRRQTGIDTSRAPSAVQSSDNSGDTSKKRDESSNRPSSPPPIGRNKSAHNTFDWEETSPDKTQDPTLWYGRPSLVSPGVGAAEGSAGVDRTSPRRERQTKKVAFNSRDISPFSAKSFETELECEKHRYRERVGLPPLVDPCISPAESPRCNVVPTTGSKPPNQPRSRPEKKSIGELSSMFEERKKRARQLLLNSTAMICEENTLMDSTSLRSSLRDPLTRSSGQSHSLPRLPSCKRSFLNPDSDANASQSIDPGVKMYEQTRSMLDHVRQCLAHSETDYLEDDYDATDTTAEQFDFPESTASFSRSSGLSPSRLRNMTASDFSLYLARKARYAQAIKLNYKNPRR
ncbi:hypothetical protein EGW08_001242 [Elysia chlorotica]|uniref:WD repeat-containing protein on Y chromosome n=1 Tax=Elysia chlorotica TaxID=188477 RepID=A0A3S1AG38_ELYCH|nr:hypothetical protein EGW08_001242 [Elysia chlorotica]